MRLRLIRQALILIALIPAAAVLPCYQAEPAGADGASPPTVITHFASIIQETGATLEGEIWSTGGAVVTQRGFEWDTDDEHPPFANSWTESGTFGTGTYNHTITGLAPGSLCYYRAKALNEAGWSYGGVITFLTLPFAPTNFTAAAGDGQVSLSWTKGQGAIRTLIRRSTTGYPVFRTDGVQVYYGTDNFKVDSGLTNLTTYYYSAWSEVTRDSLQWYSMARAMARAMPFIPVGVITDDATISSSNSAILRGRLTSLGLDNTVYVSFEWGSEPGAYSNATPPLPVTGIGDFSSMITGLRHGKTYYYRAKVTDQVTAFGLEKSFTLPRVYVDNAGSSGTIPSVSQAQPVSLPGVYVQAASLSAARALPGSPVTVNATLANKGAVNGSMAVKLYVNGSEEASRSVMVESGKTVPLQFTVVRNEPGVYAVHVGGVNAGSFVIDAAAGSDVILYFSVTLILFALVLGILYIRRSRRAV